MYPMEIVELIPNATRAVVLDPSPGAYKVEKSLIPAQFHCAPMAESLDDVQRLPS